MLIRGVAVGIARVAAVVTIALSGAGVGSTAALAATEPEPVQGTETTVETNAAAAVSEDGFVAARAILRKSAKAGAPLGRGKETRRDRSAPPPVSTPKQRWELARVNIGECNVDGNDPAELCPWDPDTNAPAAVFPRSAAEAIAREVVAQLQLPSANPQVGPDPDWNEWKSAVIGHPLWLWVDGPRTMSASNTDFGLTVALDARHVSTTFTMGDGTTRTCATTQAYARERVEPGAPSPVCGHTYQRMPKQGDTYPVTATTHWSVGWSAAGYSGTLPATMSASRDLPVTELQAVVIRHR